MNKWMLWTGAIVMIVLGHNSHAECFKACGSALAWIACAIKE